MVSAGQLAHADESLHVVSRKALASLAFWSQWQTSSLIARSPRSELASKAAPSVTGFAFGDSSSGFYTEYAA
jgi:hypothetical protein